MLNRLNEQINKVKEELATKEVLEKKLENYKLQLESDERDLRELEISLKKEFKDVEKLKKLSLVNLISTLLKNKEEKLEKEEHEYLMAKIKYDESSTRVALLKENIENIKFRLISLKNCSVEYEILLNKKIDLVKSFGENHNKIKLKELEDQIDELLIDKKEIEEAELVGEELLKELKEAEESLNSAKNWGIYDMVGGGLFSTMIKHDRISEAERSFKNIDSLILRFNEELGDISCEGITMSRNTIMIDMFFDNIFTDFSVQNKINNSLDNVISVKRRIEEVLNRLKLEKEELNEVILIKRKEYNDTIDKI